MLKYVDTKVVFSEIPDEITLAINISSCPCHCKGCHSPYLAEDIGESLTPEKVLELIDNNKGITCIAFMGGDNDPYAIYQLCKVVQFLRPEINRAWYSGRQTLPEFLNDEKLQRYSYIKLGPYIEEKGPLNNSNTNQRLYKYSSLYSDYTIGQGWRDITYKFWKNEDIRHTTSPNGDI